MLKQWWLFYSAAHYPPFTRGHMASPADIPLPSDFQTSNSDTNTQQLVSKHIAIDGLLYELVQQRVSMGKY